MGTTQGSFQQSLVEIGSVVSEEKIFKISSPLFSILSLAAILVGSRDYRTQFWKGGHPRAIPARFSLIWFSGFRGEDLNVIFSQNMPNLHNRYKSAERKISQKNPGIYVKLLLAM